MGESKIELTVGSFSFSGSGEAEWLAGQLEKILEAVPRLIAYQPAAAAEPDNTLTVSPGAGATQTLATYIKAKGGETSQVIRFLATADWLRLRGSTSLTTAAVTKALSDNQQKRLGNAADCLNKNVSKGYCEKKGDGFFITPEGLKSLGHTG